MQAGRETREDREERKHGGRVKVHGTKNRQGGGWKI